MIVRSLLIVAVVFTLSTLTLRQTSRRTVSGTVTDPNGALIAGAQVVKVNAIGFGEIVRTGIEVQANQTSDVPAQMAPAGQVETVNVAADAGPVTPGRSTDARRQN